MATFATRKHIIQVKTRQSALPTMRSGKLKVKNQDNEKSAFQRVRAEYQPKLPCHAARPGENKNRRAHAIGGRPRPNQGTVSQHLRASSSGIRVRRKPGTGREPFNRRDNPFRRTGPRRPQRGERISDGIKSSTKNAVYTASYGPCRIHQPSVHGTDRRIHKRNTAIPAAST